MLVLCFFLTAIIYSSIGFGGGSSYIALLLLTNAPYTLIPIIGLVCNIIVVSGNSFHYVRAGFFNPKLFFPLIFTSLPFAYFGGSLMLSKHLFTLLLCVLLFLSGIRLFVRSQRYNDDTATYRTPPYIISLPLGAILGFSAGLSGIGGGIFLSPMLYNLHAAAPKTIATTASLFILLNSLAGLLGQIQKNHNLIELQSYALLPLAVLIGGQIGNRIMLRFLPPRGAALLTALLVLAAALYLSLQNIDNWYLLLP